MNWNFHWHDYGTIHILHQHFKFFQILAKNYEIIVKLGKNTVNWIFKTMIKHFFEVFIKDNQMRSPLLLSGPKILKAYFKASNPKMLLQ